MATFDFSARVGRLQELMGQRGVDLTLVSVGADLLYLTGYDSHPSERLTALAVRQSGPPIMVVPDLEAPRVDSFGVEVVPWSEVDDPVSVIGALVAEPGRVAVGDHLWSVFLLRFQKQWTHSGWLPASELVGDLRLRKDVAEVEALRRAGAGVDRVMARIPSEVVFSGRTESDVARQLAAMTLEEGHDAVESTIVASGPNGASPHHTASQRTIESGDLVVCDFGGRWDGYFSDSTRTFTVGEPDERRVEVYEVVENAQRVGRETAGPGIACEDIDRATRQAIVDSGYGEFFIHRTGHGIGLEVHEHPYIVEGNGALLEPGMAFSIEPGVYLPGDFGVRIEDIAVCVEDGIVELNNSDRSLVVVE